MAYATENSFVLFCKDKHNFGATLCFNDGPVVAVDNRSGKDVDFTGIDPRQLIVFMLDQANSNKVKDLNTFLLQYSAAFNRRVAKSPLIVTYNDQQNSSSNSPPNLTGGDIYEIDLGVHAISLISNSGGLAGELYDDVCSFFDDDYDDDYAFAFPPAVTRALPPISEGSYCSADEDPRVVMPLSQLLSSSPATAASTLSRHSSASSSLSPTVFYDESSSERSSSHPVEIELPRIS